MNVEIKAERFTRLSANRYGELSFGMEMTEQQAYEALTSMLESLPAETWAAWLEKIEANK